MITAQIICDIIQKYMGLCDKQIWIYNQRKKIPPSEGLFVVVGNISAVPYGNNNKYVPLGDGYGQEISQMMQELLSVNMFSYDTSAVERMPELIGSFSSIYCQQKQDEIGFRIGVVPGGVQDTSALEASAILFRQTITLKVLRAYSKISAGEYFDKYKLDIETNTGEQINVDN
jgi:hypothetical protein